VGYYNQTSIDPTLASVFGNAGLMADAGVRSSASVVASNFLGTGAAVGLRWGAEALVAAAETRSGVALVKAAQETWKRIPMSERRAAMDWLSTIRPGSVPPGPLPPGANAEALKAYRELI
jgi:hypothetical protein